MGAPLTPDSTKDDCFDRVATLCAETTIPGYWQNLETNARTWAGEITAGPFWSSAGVKLDQWRTDYSQKYKASLLGMPGLPEFVGKSQESIRSKIARLYRRDIALVDSLFRKPEPPVPAIHDLVRTRVVCRYIDGVEYLTGQLEALAQEMQLEPCRSREGRLEGYFAQHITFMQDVFYRRGGVTVHAKIHCEIQLATEMSSRMWDASHPFYEFTRECPDAPETWQWQPNDPRFMANQLGHMIHLADGLLVNLRHAAQIKGGK